MSDRSDTRDLDQVQQRLARILEGLEHPPLGMAAALAEESGEVAACLLDHHAYGKPLDRQALAGELADVLVCVAEIASAHRITLVAALADKLVDLERRAPEWRSTLAESLRAARGDQDRSSS